MNHRQIREQTQAIILALLMNYSLGVYFFWSLTWIEKFPDWHFGERLAAGFFFFLFYGIVNILIAGWGQKS